MFVLITANHSFCTITCTEHWSDSWNREGAIYTHSGALFPHCKYACYWRHISTVCKCFQIGCIFEGCSVSASAEKSGNCVLQLECSVIHFLCVSLSGDLDWKHSNHLLASRYREHNTILFISILCLCLAVSPYFSLHSSSYHIPSVCLCTRLNSLVNIVSTTTCMCICVHVCFCVCTMAFFVCKKAGLIMLWFVSSDKTTHTSTGDHTHSKTNILTHWGAKIPVQDKSVFFFTFS